MPIRAADGTIDPRIVPQKMGGRGAEGARSLSSEVLKTSIILASNNEGQTPKRIPERGRAKKDIEVRSRELERWKRIKYESCRAKGREVGMGKRARKREGGGGN